MTGKIVCFLVLYFAEAVIAWLYLDRLFECKQRFRVVTATFAVGYLVLFAAYWIDIIALNTALFFLVNAVLIFVNYRCTLKMAVLQSAFLSFIMTGAEILVALVISLFGHEFAAYTENFSVMMVLIVLSKLLYFILTVIGARLFSPHKKVHEDPKMMLAMCGIPILSMALSVMIVYVGSYAELNPTAELLIVINVSTMFVIDLVIFVLYNRMQKANAEYTEMQLSLQKEEANMEYYKSLQEQYDNQRILIHDIKNHLHTIEGMAATGRLSEIESYVSKLDSEFSPRLSVRLSADPTLNMVLVRYNEEFERKGISFQIDVRESVEAFMDAPSITALFDNLLSNALEAAEKSSEKIIEMSIARNAEQGICLIAVSNSCDVPPLTDGPSRFRTHKEDKSHHGLGMRSIARVVRKYSGIETAYYDSDAKRFLHIIQFPTHLE